MSDTRNARVRCAAAAALVLLAGGVHRAESQRPPARAVESRVHVVARGDTLGGIAARYGVTVRALVTANSLPSERATLRVGQRLTIPAAMARTPPPAKAGPSAKAAQPASPPRRPRSTLASVPGPARDGRPCCGPRGLMLAVPEWVDRSPLFAWPVEGPITSTFGRRRAGWHRGIDIKAERGAVVFAAAGGMVVAAEIQPRYGRVVKIEHDGGFLTVYAHNEENLVESGMRVAVGDPIATIGRTGRATSHHLHFEIRHGSAVYNPLYLLPLPPRVGQVEESDENEEEHD